MTYQIIMWSLMKRIGTRSCPFYLLSIQLTLLWPVYIEIDTFKPVFKLDRDILEISDRGRPYQTFMILDSVVYTLATAVIQAVDEDSR